MFQKIHKAISGFFVRTFCVLIQIYRKFISPALPRCCRFYPTCSAYALEAFQKHGVTKGFLLSSKRILRCNPWCEGGYDPVPLR